MKLSPGIVILIFSLIALSGCVRQVSSLKQDVDIELKQNEGYLLMAVDTKYGLNSLILKGTKSIALTGKDLRPGSNYILINLPAGKYKIEKVNLNVLYYYDMEEGYWDFEVKPNVISYIGHLKVIQKRWMGNSAYFELVNESSAALEFLESKFPNILQSRDIQYWGPGEDDFFHVVGKKVAVDEVVK